MNIKILAQNIVNNPGDFTPGQIEKYFEDYAESRLSDVRQRSIAVISLDTNDFKLWKNKNDLKYDGFDARRRFKIGNTTYYCISNVCDLCSLALDEITETERAKENEEYEHIKLVAQGNMKGV